MYFLKLLDYLSAGWLVSGFPKSFSRAQLDLPRIEKFLFVRLRGANSVFKLAAADELT